VTSLSTTAGIASKALVYPKASNGQDGSKKPYHSFVITTDKGGISCLVGMYSEMGVLLMCEALGRENERVEH
jgi:hypothetical protein